MVRELGLALRLCFEDGATRMQRTNVNLDKFDLQVTIGSITLLLIWLSALALMHGIKG